MALALVPNPSTMSKPPPLLSLADAKQFKCTACGNALQVLNRRTRYVGCPYCGAVADATSEAHQKLMQMPSPSRFPPRSFIKLGMAAQFGGANYRVIGRTRWQMNYQEYDSESNSYESSTWTYDEWLMLSQYGTYFYLMEDAEGYKISRAFIPKYPTAKGTSEIRNFHTGKVVRVQEYGRATVEFFEGESTYQVAPGDAIIFANYQDGQKTYAVECRLANAGGSEIKEVEFWEDVPIGRREVLSAFAVNKEVADLKTDTETKSKRSLSMALFTGLLAVLSFIGMLASCSNTLIHSEMLATDQATLQQELPPEKPEADMQRLEQLSNSPDELQRYTDSLAQSQFANTEEANVRLIGQTQPFTLTKPGTIVCFESSVEISGYFDCWLGTEIVKANGEVANVFEGDLYRDDESHTTASVIYKLDEPGQYFLRIYTERNAILPSGSNLQVKAAVYEEKMLSRYFIMAWLLFGSLSFIYFLKSKI